MPRCDLVMLHASHCANCHILLRRILDVLVIRLYIIGPLVAFASFACAFPSEIWLTPALRSTKLRVLNNVSTPLNVFSTHILSATLLHLLVFFFFHEVNS